MGNMIGNSGAQPRKYLFIDGESFSKAYGKYARKLFNGVAPTINWISISSGYARVFYYDALPGKNQKEDDVEFETRFNNKKIAHDLIRANDRLHVREGITRFRRTRGNEQKGVDVLLAVEALQQSISGNMDEAVFFLSDLDFYPLIEAINQTRVSTRLIYEDGHASSELLATADYATALNHRMVFSWSNYQELEGWSALLQKDISLSDAQRNSELIAEKRYQGCTYALYKSRGADKYSFANIERRRAIVSGSQALAILKLSENSGFYNDELIDIFMK